MLEVSGGVFSEAIPVRSKGNRNRQREFKCDAVAREASAGPLGAGRAGTLPQSGLIETGGLGFVSHIN